MDCKECKHYDDFTNDACLGCAGNSNFDPVEKLKHELESGFYHTEREEMTNEEVINNLNMISVAFVEPVTKEQRELIDDTFDMAIKALAQNPCEDAISRQAVLDLMRSGISLDTEDDQDYICGLINDMPSVTPEERATYRKKAKRWKKKYFALKTEIEKMKAEIQNMPKTYPHTDHFDDYVKTNDVLAIIDRHIGKENE